MLPTRVRNSSDWEKSSRTMTGATAEAALAVLLPEVAREPQMSTDSSAAFVNTRTRNNKNKSQQDTVELAFRERDTEATTHSRSSSKLVNNITYNHQWLFDFVKGKTQLKSFEFGETCVSKPQFSNVDNKRIARRLW